MRVVIGSFQAESNSFSPVQCGLDMFKQGLLVYGEDVFEYFKGSSKQINAFIDVLEKENAEIIPSISARATAAAGPVTEEAYQEIESTMIKDIRANWPIDGVLLCLHGAAILTEYYDGEGRLLERIRKEVGDEVVIGVTLDFHANITEKMITSADILIGYKTYPHVDRYEVGFDAANLLVKTLNGEIRPVMAACKLPMIHQAEACITGQYPFKKIMDRVMDVESRSKALSASVFQMQPWMDLEDAGAAVIVITDGSEEMARSWARCLGQEYWNIRKELAFELTALEEAVDRAVRIKEGPVVISDSADSPSAGGTGDSTVVLEYLLNNHKDLETVMAVVDAEAVEEAIRLGVGQEGEFSLGGKIGEYSKPVTVRGTVKLISDGDYVLEKVKKNMGRTAVIRSGRLSILVMEVPTSITNPSLYRSVGLEPLNAKLVVVKSALNFRGFFKDIAKEIYVVDTPGSASSNLTSMPFKNLKRPMYPFDEMESLGSPVIWTGRQKNSN